MEIVNRPTFIPKEEYLRAIEYYLGRVKRISGVISVNTMGSIGAPGLSDIDLIVVVEDDFCELESATLSVNGIDDRLFLHGPVVIPESLAPDLQYLIFASNVNNLYGRDCLRDFDSLGTDVRYSLSICYLVDFIESRFSQFAEVQRSGVIDQRAWLTRLWSVTHSCSLLESVGLRLTQREEILLDPIKRIRADWNATQYVDDCVFLQAFANAKELNARILKKALTHQYGHMSDFAEGVKSVNLGAKYCRFVSGSDVPVYEVKKRVLFGRDIGGYVCKQSPLYAVHLSGYKLLRLESSKDVSVSDQVHLKIMEKRRVTVERHRDWLNTRAHKAGSMSGYLGAGRIKRKGILNSIKHSLHELALRL